MTLRLTRKAREKQRAGRLILGITSATLVIVTILVTLLAPKDTDKPLVTLYMPADCSTCRNYEAYLREHGFRVQIGAGAEIPAIRARWRIPPIFQAPQIAIVDGMFFEGHVPAADIHRLLDPRNRGRARGLVVPGTPKGAPGLTAAVPEPYTVYLVRGSGLVQPVKTYHHGFR